MHHQLGGCPGDSSLISQSIQNTKTWKSSLANCTAHSLQIRVRVTSHVAVSENAVARGLATGRGWQG